MATFGYMKHIQRWDWSQIVSEYPTRRKIQGDIVPLAYGVIGTLQISGDNLRFLGLPRWMVEFEGLPIVGWRLAIVASKVVTWQFVRCSSFCGEETFLSAGQCQNRTKITSWLYMLIDKTYLDKKLSYWKERGWDHNEHDDTLVISISNPLIKGVSNRKENTMAGYNSWSPLPGSTIRGLAL